ncbi:MAG: hypothetical protein FDX18_09405 [Chlorobium sp.]|nr:MAG: hypothetical protein FDX18_09405 [Chlorobium sp.]
MAQEEKKGGFFSAFKKSTTSGSEAQASPAVPAQPRNIPAPESKSVVEQPKPAVAAKPAVVAEPSEPAIDTVAAFNRYCSSLADIGASQLKVVEMTLTMLTGSINKIADGLKSKK